MCFEEQPHLLPAWHVTHQPHAKAWAAHQKISCRTSDLPASNCGLISTISPASGDMTEQTAGSTWPRDSKAPSPLKHLQPQSTPDCNAAKRAQQHAQHLL